jgi:hypothetical protein
MPKSRGCDAEFGSGQIEYEKIFPPPFSRMGLFSIIKREDP